MKTRDLITTIAYLLIISVFVVVIFTKSFDRLIQISIIFGTGLGFYSFYRQRDNIAKRLTLLLTTLLPIVVLISISIFNWEIPNIMLVSVLFIAFYLSLLLGFVLNKLRIRNDIKLAIVIGIIFVFLSALTRKLNHGTSASLTILFATLAILILNPKSKEKSIRLLFIFNSIYLVINLLLGTYPEVLQLSLIFTFIVLLSGLVHLMLFKPIKKIRKLSIIFLITSLFAIIAWFGQENYEKWFFARLENEIIQARVNYSFISLDNIHISSNDTIDRTIVVLFWSEACASCKKEFPYFSKLAEAYKDDTTKVFLAAYLSYNNLESEYFNEITKEQYSFLWVQTDESKQLMKALKMKGVPHLSIFNENDELLYNGLVCNRPWIWVNRPSKFFVSQ